MAYHPMMQCMRALLTILALTVSACGGNLEPSDPPTIPDAATEEVLEASDEPEATGPCCEPTHPVPGCVMCEGEP